jgi:tripartite-type tricarboxylate transporter receptor subunit TctC
LTSFFSLTIKTLMRSLWLIIIALGFFVTGPVAGQDLFYQGKTIRLIVGTAAGGGFDTYSRVVARHMGRHIPGNPTIIVDNMPGAAHLVSANHIYNVATPVS